MIKTIKVKKQLRLDELIKYIFDNGIKDKTYGVTVFNNTSEVRVSGAGNINMSGFNNEKTTFTVEVEEEITGLTRFERALALTLSAQGRIQLISHDYENLTLGKILKANNHRDLHQVYAMINGKLELVWESGSDEI